MSSEKEEAKTVTLPTFSGGKKKYAIWWKRFQAYAIIKKFDDALFGFLDVPLKNGESIDTIVGCFHEGFVVLLMSD